MKLLAKLQTRRHGGAYRGRAPPNKNCAPPSEDCASKKFTGSGLLECKSRPRLVFFWTDIGFHNAFGMKAFFWRSPVFGRKIPRKIGEELLFFFWRSPVFGQKDRLNFRFRPENPFESLVFTLFILSRLG